MGTRDRTPCDNCFWLLWPSPSLSNQCLTPLVLMIGSGHLHIPTYLGIGTLKDLPWPCCQRCWPLSQYPLHLLLNTLLQGHMFHSVVNIALISLPIHSRAPSPQRSRTSLLIITHLPLVPLLEPLPILPSMLQPTSWSLSTLCTPAPILLLQFGICFHLLPTVSHFWLLAYDLVMLKFTLQQIHSPSPPILSS